VDEFEEQNNLHDHVLGLAEAIEKQFTVIGWSSYNLQSNQWKR